MLLFSFYYFRFICYHIHSPILNRSAQFTCSVLPAEHRLKSRRGHFWSGRGCGRLSETDLAGTDRVPRRRCTGDDSCRRCRRMSATRLAVDWTIRCHRLRSCWNLSNLTSSHHRTSCTHAAAILTFEMINSYALLKNQVKGAPKTPSIYDQDYKIPNKAERTCNFADTATVAQNFRENQRYGV